MVMSEIEHVVVNGKTDGVQQQNKQKHTGQLSQVKSGRNQNLEVGSFFSYQVQK
jgi:hypothetical protein